MQSNNLLDVPSVVGCDTVHVIQIHMAEHPLLNGVNKVNLQKPYKILNQFPILTRYLFSPLPEEWS